MHPQSPARERRVYVDGLRIGAFALLVLYHGGMVYVPWDIHVKRQFTCTRREPLMRLTNPSRMGLLFVNAGLATGLMLGRAGLARERSRRLLLPLLLLGSVRALLFPRFDETHALLDDWAAHAAFAPLFAFGVLLAQRRVLLQRLQDLRWPALALGLAGWAVRVLYRGTLPGWPAVPEALRAPMRAAFATAQWCGVVAAFGFARRHLDVDHRWCGPLTEAVFPLYLVHQTILIVAAVALRPPALAAGLEAAVSVALTCAGGWAAWRLARRIGGLRPWTGLSARPPAPAHQRAAASSA